MQVTFLKTARRLAGLSLSELSARCGVERTVIWKLETGRIKKPSHELVVRIAAALGCTPEELFPVALQPPEAAR